MFKVLLVEDDEDLRKLYRRHLSVDYDVTPVDNSVKALELYKQGGFDLVLTDTRLDTDLLLAGSKFRYKEGIKLLIDILKFDKKAKVIVMSSIKDNKEPAMANGALKFINKDLIKIGYFKKVLDDYL